MHFRRDLNASALCEKAASLADQTIIVSTLQSDPIFCPPHQQSCPTTKMRWTLMRPPLSPRSNFHLIQMRRAREALPTCLSSCRIHYHGMSLPAIMTRNRLKCHQGRKVQTKHSRRRLRSSGHPSYNQQVCRRQQTTPSPPLWSSRYWKDVNCSRPRSSYLWQQKHAPNGSRAQRLRRSWYRRRP